MKRLIKNKKKARLRILGIMIATVFIVVGVAMSVVVIQQFQKGIERDQDDWLENTILAIDYNISDLINRFNVQTGIFVNSDGFAEALDEWELTGNEDVITEKIESASPGTMRVFASMIIRDSETNRLYSYDGKNYTIVHDYKENIYMSTDEDGKGSVAVKYELRNGLSCYAIISVEKAFGNVLQRVNASDKNILLLEECSNNVYYHDGKNVKSVKVGNYKELSKAYATEAEMLVDSQNTGRSDGQTYEKGVTDDGEVITIRTLAMPINELTNSAFAISASADYHVLDALLFKTVKRLIFSFLLMAFGLLVTVVIAMRINRERILVDVELENLKAKNKEMEEINKKTQELAHHQRLEAIGVMTSGIAHEFNNLLTPIMGYSMMTLEKLPQDDDTIYDDVLEIYNASVKAKDIISRLSELARKNTEVAFKKINPDVLANKVINVASPSLPKNVDLIRNFNCSDCYLKGNEVQLSQLLLNLLINAFQELKYSGGDVNVETRLEGDEIVFVCRDNGGGIDEEVRDKIFEPFFTTKETGAGTGLGLAIAMQAVEDHGGRIELTSELGVGSEFRVYIPIVK